MALKKENIHGFWLEYDEGFYDGVRYLRDDLQRGETSTLFTAAKIKGSAEFEDDCDRDRTLIYNRNSYSYSLIRRQKE